MEDWEAKYAECCELLVEAQHQLRLQQNQQQLTVVHQHFATVNPFIPEGSLAHELEDTIRRDLQMAGRENAMQRRKNCDRVLETARCVRQTLERHHTDASLLSISQDLLSAPRSDGERLQRPRSLLSDIDASDDDGYAMTESFAR